MIVDAHHHLWRQAQYQAIYDAYGSPSLLQPLLRDFAPKDMKPLLLANEVDRTVLIQIETNDAHNQDLLDLAMAHEFIGAVIGWADLEADDLDEQLKRLCRYEKFKGIRDPLELKPEAEWILQPTVLRGLRVLAEHGLIFELLINHTHWGILPQLADAIPELTLVINHFGKPNSHCFEEWSQMLASIASHLQIWVKLSGIMVLFPETCWQDWSVGEVRLYVDKLVDTLGPQRLMLATDWPVSTLVGSYAQVLRCITDCLDDLSEAEQAHILGDNARRLYDIQ